MYFDHSFAVRLEWGGPGAPAGAGAGADGASKTGADAPVGSRRRPSRLHTITAEGNPPIAGSSARAFHGDADHWNPEQLLIASLSQCHLLSYLYLAQKAGIEVLGYVDDATGVLRQEGDGGRFESVTLRPLVTIGAGDPDAATALHDQAHRVCFIAASVAFPVRYEPVTVTKS